MLKLIGILAMIYVGVVAQSSLIHDVATEFGGPFVPAMLLVLIAAALEGTPAVMASALLGLILDGASTERLGLQMTFATVFGFALQALRPVWGSRSIVALVSMAMLATVCWRIAAPVTQSLLAGRTIDPHSTLTSAVQDSAWTAVVAGVLILVWRGLTRTSHAGPGRLTARASPRWDS
jgi:rod shape-determining protein MreD